MTNMTFGIGETYNCRSPALFNGDAENRLYDLLGGAKFNPIVLTRIELPNGQSYLFTHNVWGEITKVVYPTGAYERFDYAAVASLGAIEKRCLRCISNREKWHCQAEDSSYCKRQIGNRRVLSSQGGSMVKQQTRKSHDIEIELGDVAYIRLPGFEKGAKVSKTVSLRDLVKDLKGPDLELDFSEDGTLMGVEILAF